MDAEWITKRKYLSSAKTGPVIVRKMLDNDKDILKMEHLWFVLYCPPEWQIFESS
jgi:hypothetical protein